MDQRADRSLEFVLDNRRLIIGFFLLVAVCGVFFVIGFMEGKRQAVLSAALSPVPEPASDGSPVAPTQTAENVAKPKEDRPVSEQLDWYGTVNKPGEPTRGLEPLPEPVQAVVKGPEPSAPVAAAAETGSYTVQVGAFRQRREADAAAARLKAKGYDCTIDVPTSPKALFILKVGSYSTRADAAAAQVRLQRDGFKSFVKTTG